MPSFIHLRLHTEYSITDGIVRIDEALERAEADGMPALAITDLANLFGAVKFYTAARRRGVKPIIGADVRVESEAARDKPARLLLLAQSSAGYLRLCDLLTRAWLENQRRGTAEIRRAWLGAEGGGTDGLIALSGALAGDVGIALLAGNTASAERAAAGWKSLFPGRFYIELQRAGAPHTEEYIEAALRLAGSLALPVVATHPVQFLGPDDFLAHEARVCIAEGHVLSDQRRPRVHTEQSWFVTQADMAQRFADLPEALANAVEIARRCSLELELGRTRLPLFPTPGGETLESWLESQAQAGLTRRLEALWPDAGALAEAAPRYRERLAFELKTIVQMGFAGYYLIVADIIGWARANDVPVGPGRGSGAGSLVAYALGITDIDPLRYGLLFERFLNPERVSMPDFDIDFCPQRRDRVIEYIKQKFGRESVSQIATFGTLAARAVVRDVGRVMEWGYSRTDELAKLIPFQPGKVVTLRRRQGAGERELIYAREVEPQINAREAADEETRELLALAEQLEGLTRNVGMHAGGVLIAPGRLTDFCPLYAAEGTDNVISQFDKDDVEAIGLVKFDFLGLTTLTVLDGTLRSLRASGIAMAPLDRLPLDDADTYAVFASANTTAVFQFESRGMRDLLKRARPDRFEDLIALVALYRPGPMDLIPDFIDRKHGRKPVHYPDARLEPILGPTYGVMVYQEQVMQIAQVIGGYSLGAADLLRRAMGKKKPEEMAKHRDVFVAGAIGNGVARATAEELFGLMEKFAGYGFNKSHAAAYALVAYQTAYLKAHHGAAFMAANLSAVADDTDKVRQFCADAAEGGLKLLAPDVNASGLAFAPVDPATIRFGLGAIKGTGESAIASIVSARATGPFRDLFDFCARVDKRLVNRRVVEALVRAGAFDAIDDRRATLFASVGIALEAAESAERHANQANLFDAGSLAQAPSLALIERPAWGEAERLAHEKAVLGFYYSGHPFTVWRDEVRRFIRGDLRALAGSGGTERAARTQLVAGVVESIRTQRAQGARMTIVELGDGTARQEISIYPEIFERHRDLIREDALLVFEVRARQVRRASEDEGEAVFTRISTDRVMTLAEARGRFARQMRLSMNGQASEAGAAAVARLKTLLAPYRNGPCPVAIAYRNGEASAEVRLGEDWRVSLDDALLAALGDWLDPRNVEVLYA